MSYTNQDAPYTGTGVGNQKFGTTGRNDDATYDGSNTNTFGTTQTGMNKPNTFDSTRTGDYADRFDNTPHNATGGVQGLASRTAGTGHHMDQSTVTGSNQGLTGRGGAGNHGFAASALGNQYGDAGTDRTMDPMNPNTFGTRGNMDRNRDNAETAGTDMYNTDKTRREGQFGDIHRGTREDDPSRIQRTARRESRSRSRSRSRSNSRDRENRNRRENNEFDNNNTNMTGKVPMGEKIKGTLEQVKGKVTKNPELVHQGAERKAGTLVNEYGHSFANTGTTTGTTTGPYSGTKHDDFIDNSRRADGDNY